MDSRITWEEMRAQYPDQWVFVLDPVLDDNKDILSGIVHAADVDFSELTTLAIGKRSQPHVFRFTGRIHPQIGLAKWSLDGRL